MNASLKDYINDHYPLTKSDLMTVFMEVDLQHLRDAGRLSMINLPSWMFLSSFEKFRKSLLKNNLINNLLHLGRGIFGSDFGSVCFCITKKTEMNVLGTYRRLFQQHVKVDSVEEKERRFFNEHYGYFYFNQNSFLKIPGALIAYWLSDKVLENFGLTYPLEKYGEAKQGLATTDNERFLRFWYEVETDNLGLNFDSREIAKSSKKKWFPYNKGGRFQKWYGNQDLVINWENDGKELFDLRPNAVIRSPHLYFLESISWSKVTAGAFSIRYFPKGFIFDVAGCSIFYKDKNVQLKHLGILNSKIGSHYLTILSPTLNYEVGTLTKFPCYQIDNPVTLELVSNCIDLSKSNWNARETSWDFDINPLIKNSDTTISNSLSEWISQASKDFFQIHQNEEELNKIFIEIYGLQDELTPDVPLTEITILQDELDFKKLEKAQKNVAKLREEGLEKFIKKDAIIQQLLSYAIGCFMGRYRLDKPGLHIAHPNPTEEEIKSYKIKSPLHNGKKDVIFEIDDDGIIPMLGSYGRFSE